MIDQITEITNTVLALEDHFTELGAGFYELKKSHGYRFKGYEKWSDYVEQEHGISSAFANKLVRIYRIFAIEMQKDTDEMSAIGLDKLVCIASLFPLYEEDVAAHKKKEWYKSAQELSLTDLKYAVKEEKEALKNYDPVADMIRSWKERWIEPMGGTWKEMQLRLAMFFTEIEHHPEIDGMLSRWEKEANKFKVQAVEMKQSQHVHEFAATMQQISDKEGITCILSVGEQSVSFTPSEAAK